MGFQFDLTLSPYDFDIQLQYTFPVFGYVMQFWMAINFSFGTFLSWCGLLNKQCWFEALFPRKKHFWLPSIMKVLPEHFLLIFGKVTKKKFLIIRYVLRNYSPSGSTDFFILIECFDSQLFDYLNKTLILCFHSKYWESNIQIQICWIYK